MGVSAVRQMLFVRFLVKGNKDILSPGEIKVARMIANGQSYQTIADTLPAPVERVKEVANRAARKINTRKGSWNK